MMDINNIDQSLAVLNTAINDHYGWAGQMLQLGLLGGEPNQALLDPQAHLKCRFSEWIKVYVNKPSRGIEMVRKIERDHKEMHDRARHLLTSIINKQVNQTLLDNYHTAQQQFIHTVDQYKQAVFTFRNMHDTLTGLPLRHLLYQDFDHLRRCGASVTPLWLLVMDIDRFKAINDNWGHNAGDNVLRAVARTLKAGTRCHETIYRFGGEEFVTLLHCHSEAEAICASKRIARYLEQTPITIGSDEITVTVTGGLTRVRPVDSLHDAIGRADQAMYHGKNTRRNRCVLIDAGSDEMRTL